MTDIEQKGTLEFCAPKFLFCCEELPFVRMHIFSVKAVSGWMKMKKTLVGILVFDMIMGMLCLWAGGKRQDTTAPASQEVSTGKIAGEEDVAKKIALTFDDGPHPRYTEQLLDGLKERNVVATFFVTGENAQNYPNIIRREQEEGHLIGNHTYSHIQLTSGNRETFREELVKTNEILENITGEKVSFVRPPYGSWDKSFEKELKDLETLYTQVTGQAMKKYYRPPQGKYSETNLQMAKDLGYSTFFWSLAYVDWNVDAQPSHEEAFSKLTGRIHPGAVVLLHNTSKTNGEILDELLTKWEEMGYTFGKLEELVP